MKKSLFLFVIGSAIMACTPKAAKSTASTAKTGASTETTAGPASAKPSATNGPGETELTAAKTKFPNVSIDQLQKGHSIYYGACTKCHGAANIVKGSEEKWAHVLDEMAPKANLGADEKEAVWRYIMSVKLAAK